MFQKNSIHLDFLLPCCLVIIMSPKRIIIFGYAGSVHILKWANSLKERGFQVRVISLGSEMIDGIDVVTFPRAGKLSYIKHASKAAKAALDFNPDIIHVHYAGGYGLWGLKTKFHPLVVSVWGSDIVTLPKSFYYRYLVKRVLSKADIITATSKSLSKTTIKLAPSVVDKMKIIPFGVKIPKENIDFPNENETSAIYIKHLHSIYGPDILIKATAIVIKKFREFRLTMCGTGPLENELKQLIKTYKLENNIKMIGQVENSSIYDLLEKHHFMVMPSLEEGFGVAAVESFACSRPVVATNVGGIPEIVTDGKNGYLINPNDVQKLADAMIKMISDKNKMIQMGRNGYQVAKQRFDWEKSVDQMIEVYENL